ncbi:hypothetical protein QBC38DRAFT_60239 [Podospora fimiseda]|uniref:F-box domain-containing protein n=1 Tax=Podospora fimiseda TaxID=252190 RepID=A0AAN7GRW0_9PEZI|nr:hypothetical protein QBC38DRAFT_60239 [Podospora fimiseda]
MTSSPPAPILSLPMELWFTIMADLPSSKKAVLCRASKDLCSQTEPLLYRDITLTRRKNQMPPMARLLSKLAHRPDLAASIRNISLIENKSF